MPSSPQLDKLLRDAVKEGIARVHTQVPGRVLEYDHSTQKAKVQLIIEHAFDDDGSVGYYKPAPLVNVPVIFPAILTWPIESGQPGWVQIAERSIDEYEATGNDNVKPRDLRRFDLSDAVFYPCYLRGEADTADGAAVLNFDEIRLGSSGASEFVALASLVEARLQAIEEYLREHEHYYTAPAIPASPAPTAKALGGGANFPGSPDPTAPVTFSGDTASDKVKGE